MAQPDPNAGQHLSTVLHPTLLQACFSNAIMELKTGWRSSCEEIRTREKRSLPSKDGEQTSTKTQEEWSRRVAPAETKAPTLTPISVCTGRDSEGPCYESGRNQVDNTKRQAVNRKLFLQFLTLVIWGNELREHASSADTFDSFYSSDTSGALRPLRRCMFWVTVCQRAPEAAFWACKLQCASPTQGTV